MVKHAFSKCPISFVDGKHLASTHQPTISKVLKFKILFYYKSLRPLFYVTILCKIFHQVFNCLSRSSANEIGFCKTQQDFRADHHLKHVLDKPKRNGLSNKCYFALCLCLNFDRFNNNG